MPTAKKEIRSKNNGIIIKAPNGVKYKSLQALCDDYEVNYNRIYYYHKTRKLPLETAIEKVREGEEEKKPKKTKKKAATIDHLGKRYRSTNKMCQAWGVDPSTYRCRLERGWSKEDALTKPAGPNRSKNKELDKKPKETEQTPIVVTDGPEIAVKETVADSTPEPMNADINNDIATSEVHKEPENASFWQRFKNTIKNWFA